MRKGIVLKLLMGMAFCFLCLAGQKNETKADLILWPEDEFIKEHRDECEISESEWGYRTFEVTPEAVDVFHSPKSDVVTDHLSKGDAVPVYYIYSDKETLETWGCIDGNYWISMKNMRLVYDHIEFVKDHKTELYIENGESKYYNITYPLTFYEFPGTDEDGSKIEKERIQDSEATIHERLEGCMMYKDTDGNIWAYVDTYSYGYLRGWMRISDYEKLDEPWTLSDDIYLNADYEEGLTMEDARRVLKSALGITSEGRDYTLEDAQRCLEYALGIR